MSFKIDILDGVIPCVMYTTNNVIITIPIYNTQNYLCVLLHLYSRYFFQYKIEFIKSI